MQNLKHVLDFKLRVKEGLNNLSFSIGFQMLTKIYFQMLKIYEYVQYVTQWHQNSFFSKKLRKIAQRLGALSPVPRL